MSPPPSATLLALDWGTSSARAYLLGAGGAILERHEAPLGVMQVGAGAHAAALSRLLGDWDSLALPRIASGMIGSRQGWIEVPYVECPADASMLARGIVATPHGELSIVPGLVCRDADGVPDVLRGEEAQIVGALDGDDASLLAVLPGTHSKWLRVDTGRLVSFETYMTGELYAVLLAHSILGRLATPGVAAASDRAAFADGVRRGLAGDALAHTIFGARTRCLLGELAGADVGDWLSGLLIGHEIRGAWRNAGALVASLPVQLIGTDALVERYQVALGLADIRAATAPPDAAARGLYRIARQAGMVQ